MAHLPKGRPVGSWFQGEARVGQDNERVRIRAKKGTGPRLPADQRCQSRCLFGAICPGRGTAAALVLPTANTMAMQMHLDEIGKHVAQEARAVVGMDRAGWHTTARLIVPGNITIILLPPRSPELNPVENIWQHLRANQLSSRVLENCNAIVDAACDAWNALIDEPRTMTSIGMRKWAHVDQ